MRSRKQTERRSTKIRDARRHTPAGAASAGRQRAAGGGGRTEKQTPLNERGCSAKLHREPEGSSECAIVSKSWSGEGTIEREREKGALRGPAPGTRHQTRTRTRSNSKRHVAGCTTFKHEVSHTRHSMSSLSCPVLHCHPHSETLTRHSHALRNWRRMQRHPRTVRRRLLRQRLLRQRTNRRRDPRAAATVGNRSE